MIAMSICLTTQVHKLVKISANFYSISCDGTPDASIKEIASKGKSWVICESTFAAADDASVKLGYAYALLVQDA